MTQNWMIDVLRDLRSFAAKNAMLELAEHLDDAVVIASAEMLTQNPSAEVVEGDARKPDYRISGKIGGNRHC
jgi:hypothetical protein